MGWNHFGHAHRLPCCCEYKNGMHSLIPPDAMEGYRVTLWSQLGELVFHGTLAELDEWRQLKRRKKPVWFEAMEPLSSFTGRVKELATLHNMLQESTQPTCVCGIGGIGKTEFVRKYVRDYAKDYDYNVIWIDARTKDSILEDFRELAEDELKMELFPPKYKVHINAVYKWCSPKKSLFVFENAERNDFFVREILSELRALNLGKMKPYVIIISRLNYWGFGINILQLKDLDRMEAVEFVKEQLKVGDDNLVYELVDRLQCFPLVLRQAVDYIYDKWRSYVDYGIDSFLKELEQNKKEIFESNEFKSFFNDYNQTIYTTWTSTIEKIRSEKEHGELAIDILNFIANVDGSICRQDLKEYFHSDHISGALILLLKYSMINRDNDQYSMHKLIREVIRLNN